MRRAFPWLIPLLAALNGCTVASPPAMPQACSGPSRIDPWWQRFDDPALTGVLTALRRCNLDLARKALEIERNRLAVERWSASLSGSLSAHTPLPLDGRAADPAFEGRLNLSYELDLWGRLARARDADRWLVLAGRYEHQALVLTLDAEAARLYWRLAAAVARQTLARQALAIHRRLETLTQAGADTGAWPQRDAWQETQRRLAAERHLAWLAEDEAAARTALSALLDRGGLLRLPATPLPAGPLPSLPDSMAAQLLDRRPDVAARQAQLQRQRALLDHHSATLLPALTLRGTLGVAGDALRRWLSQPVGSLAAGLSLPLDWHNLSLTRRQAMLDWQAAALDYHRVVALALRESADALAALARTGARQRQLAAELALAGRAEREAALRWRLGDSDRLTALRARLQRLSLEQASLAARADHLAALTGVYRALGGAPVNENAGVDAGVSG